MTPFEQAIQDLLNKLDKDKCREDEIYQDRRDTLLSLIKTERGIANRNLTNGEVATVPPRPLVAIGLNPGEIVAQKAIVKIAIKSLVSDGKTEFTKSDVLARLEEGKAAGVNVSDHTLKNIASFLWRFHSDDEKFIVIKEKGGGQRQHVYTLAPTDPAS